MAIGDELGIAIPAVVDEGFLHAAETRSRIGADVLETQRLDDIHHVIGTTAIVGRQNIDLRWSIALGCGHCAVLGCGLRSRRTGPHHCRGRCQHPGLQEFPSLQVFLLCHKSSDRQHYPLLEGYKRASNPHHQTKLR